MNFKTILMPKVILAKFLLQKSYSYLTFLTKVYFNSDLERMKLKQLLHLPHLHRHKDKVVNQVWLNRLLEYFGPKSDIVR